jgi:hypothetical protein
MELAKSSIRRKKAQNGWKKSTFFCRPRHVRFYGYTFHFFADPGAQEQQEQEEEERGVKLEARRRLEYDAAMRREAAEAEAGGHGGSLARLRRLAADVFEPKGCLE